MTSLKKDIEDLGNQEFNDLALFVLKCAGVIGGILFLFFAVMFVLAALTIVC